MEENSELIIAANNSKELEKIPHIREILVFCHIINSIRSVQRMFFLCDNRPDTPARKRDTVFFLLSNSSYLYEGMHRAYQLLRHFPNELPKELQSEFVWLRTEVKTDRNSFFKIILSSIRNELVFHFTHALCNQPFSSTVTKYPPILGQGTSIRSIDFVYNLPDDLITYYLASLVKHPEYLEESFVTTEPLKDTFASHSFPESLRDRIQYDDGKLELVFQGLMKDDDRDLLLRISESPSYQEAIKSLSLKTRLTWLVIQLRRYSIRFCEMVDNIIPSLIVQHAELIMRPTAVNSEKR